MRGRMLSFKTSTSNQMEEKNPLRGYSQRQVELLGDKTSLASNTGWKHRGEGLATSSASQGASVSCVPLCVFLVLYRDVTIPKSHGSIIP